MNLAIYTLCLLGCLAALPAHAQIAKGKKLVEQRQYKAALEAFMNDLERPHHQPIALFEMARIYANAHYAEQDLNTAYRYASRALNQYAALSSTDKKKVQAKGVNQANLGKLQKDLLARAYQRTKDSRDLNRHNIFLEEFTTASQQQRKIITQQRDQLAFDQAASQNTYEAYYKLWSDYRSTLELYNLPLFRRLQKNLLERYTDEKGWAMYPHFENLFPNNIYVKDNEAAYAYLRARQKNTIAAYQDFLQAYQRKPFSAFGIDGLHALVLESDNLHYYDAFVRAYPDHEEIDVLWKRFYQLYREQRGQKAVEEFAQAYPQFPFPKQLTQDRQSLQTALEKPLYERIVAEKNTYLVLDFLAKHPESLYAQKMESPLYESLKITPLPRASKLFLKKYPRSPHYDEVLALYYEAITQDGELGTLNQFMMEHPEYKGVQRQQRDLALAEQGAQLRLSEPMPPSQAADYEAYIKAAAPKERAWVALQRLLEKNLHSGEYKVALATLERLGVHFGENDQRVKGLKELLIQATDQYYLSIDFNPALNKKALKIADLSLDGQQLLLLEPTKGQPLLPWEITRRGGVWGTLQKAEQWVQIAESGALLEDVSSDKQRSVWSIRTAADGVELWESTQGPHGWSAPVSLSLFGQVPHNSSQGYLTADGQALLFSSNYTAGLVHSVTSNNDNDAHGNPRGNWDLFVCLKQANGTWGAPINLGDRINTPYEEGYAFLHPDGETLYFSSEGHGGLGRLDIYRSTRLSDDWTQWSTPVHLSIGINSPDNDAIQAVSTDGELLYWSRDWRAFSGPLAAKSAPQPVNLYNGTVNSLQKAPLSVNLSYRSTATEHPQQGQQAARAGEFVLPLRTGLSYYCWVEHTGYWSSSAIVPSDENTALTAYTATDLIGSLMALQLDGDRERRIADLTRLATFVKKEDLVILLPKGNKSVNGFTAASIETILKGVGCPQSKIAWYSPQSAVESNTALLVGFDVLP